MIPIMDGKTGEKSSFVVTFNTGWTKYWPDQNTYAGLSEQLVTYLIARFIDTLFSQQNSFEKISF
jgi:kynurenine formamidase